MSIYESSVTNPKKQLEFYKQLSEQLQQENQELKTELEESNDSITWYHNRFNAINKQNKELKRKLNEAIHKATEFESEVYELKKQLEETNEKIILLQASEPMLNYKKALEENQQKEFIEYLTHELNTSYTNSSRYYYFSLILSKYREIIGGKDEDKNK